MFKLPPKKDSPWTEKHQDLTLQENKKQPPLISIILTLGTLSLFAGVPTHAQNLSPDFLQQEYLSPDSGHRIRFSDPDWQDASFLKCGVTGPSGRVKNGRITRIYLKRIIANHWAGRALVQNRNLWGLHSYRSWSPIESFLLKSEPASDHLQVQSENISITLLGAKNPVPTTSKIRNYRAQAVLTRQSEQKPDKVAAPTRMTCRFTHNLNQELKYWPEPIALTGGLVEIIRL